MSKCAPNELTENTLYFIMSLLLLGVTTPSAQNGRQYLTLYCRLKRSRSPDMHVDYKCQRGQKGRWVKYLSTSTHVLGLISGQT